MALNDLLSFAEGNTPYAYHLDGSGFGPLTPAVPGTNYPTTNMIWDGQFIYAFVNADGQDVQLARIDPQADTPSWTLLLGGAVLTVSSASNVVFGAGKAVGACTDGQNLYWITGAQQLAIYNILSDTVNIDAGSISHLDQLVWDGNNCVYGFQLLANVSTCFKLTIDSALTTDAYPVTPNPNSEIAQGYAALAGTVYGFFTEDSNSVWRAGHCIDSGTELAFAYQSSSINQVTANLLPGGCFTDSQTWAIGGGWEAGMIVFFTLSGGTLTSSTLIPHTGTGPFLASSFAYTAAYATTFELLMADRVTPVPALGPFGVGGYAPGIPTRAIEYFAEPNSDLGEVVVYVPVQPQSVVAQYVQLSVTPSGPWQDAYDLSGAPLLLSLGAGLAGQKIPFFVRVFPPATLFPGAFDNYEFSVAIGIGGG